MNRARVSMKLSLDFDSVGQLRGDDIDANRAKLAGLVLDIVTVAVKRSIAVPDSVDVTVTETSLQELPAEEKR